jgi:hypothetical protein
VWSAAEIAVTLICIGIPVCRPLYKRAFRRLFGEISSAGYQKQSNNNVESGSVPLRTIGGGLIGADGKPVVRSKKDTAASNGNSKNATCVDKDESGSDELSFRDVKLGVNGPFTRTTVGRGGMGSSDGGGVGADEGSDEEILDEYRRNQIRSARASDERDMRITTADPNHGHAHAHAGDSGHGHHGIMVTETYRVERS